MSPQLSVTCRQYGWSGEKTAGFFNRMDKDCLTFEPTVATLAYGMNDSNYRPFDVNNGRWYEDHYTAIVRNFKDHDVRVVVGSPGCAGKIAEWVKRRAGTLDQHNVHLCALRDIAMGVAEREDVRFADIFWPMYQAQVLAPAQHRATAENLTLLLATMAFIPAGQVTSSWRGRCFDLWDLMATSGLLRLIWPRIVPAQPTGIRSIPSKTAKSRSQVPAIHFVRAGMLMTSTRSDRA